MQTIWHTIWPCISSDILIGFSTSSGVSDLWYLELDGLDCLLLEMPPEVLFDASGPLDHPQDDMHKDDRGDSCGIGCIAFVADSVKIILCLLQKRSGKLQLALTGALATNCKAIESFERICLADNKHCTMCLLAQVVHKMKLVWLQIRQTITHIQYIKRWLDPNRMGRFLILPYLVICSLKQCYCLWSYDWFCFLDVLFQFDRNNTETNSIQFLFFPGSPCCVAWVRTRATMVFWFKNDEARRLPALPIQKIRGAKIREAIKKPDATMVQLQELPNSGCWARDHTTTTEIWCYANNT